MPVQIGTLRKRVGRIRDYLQKKGLSAYLTFDIENFKYLTGCLGVVGSRVERPVVGVFTLDGDPSLVMCEIAKPYYDHDLENGRVWIKDVRYYLEHPRLTNRMETVSQFPELTAKALRDKGVERGSVGADVQASVRIQEALPDVRFLNEGELLREMRFIKDAEELELMRSAASLSDMGQKVFKEELKVGRYECEVGTEAARTVLVEAAKRHPGSIVSARAVIMLGPFGMTSGVSRTRMIEKGDVLTNNVPVHLDNYLTENERTFVMGEPSERQRRVFNVMVEAQSKGIEAAVVENRICDIDTAAQKVIEDAGLGEYIAHRTGHGQGLLSHEYPYDMAFNTRPLKPGMIFSCEPGIYIPGFASFRHSDNIVITDGPAEVLSKFPKDLESLVVR